MASTNANVSNVLPPLFKKLPEDRKLKISQIKDGKEELRCWERKIELKDTPDYPTPYIFAELASAVYNDCEKDMTLPTGWKLLATATNAHTSNGYFGAAFCHPENHQVIIAHRGTKLAVIGAIMADIKGIVFNNYVAQMSSAITFADRVVQDISELNKDRDFQLFFAGHSLGGWLAQITTLTIEYMSPIDGFFLKIKDPKPSQYHAHSVVFDSPGCKPMLSQIISDADLRYSGCSIELDSLDITSYLSAPNRINTCNAHVGKIYRVLADLSKIGWLKKKTATYNLAAHCMDRILQEFDPITGHAYRNASGHLKLEEVVDWPISGTFSRGEEYKRLFEFADHKNNYHLEGYEKELLIKTESGYKKIRYQTKPVDEKSCLLNVFTLTERQFLGHYRWLREWPDIFELFNVSDTSCQEVLKDYDITENSVCCSTAVTLNKFIPYIKRMLRLFPGISEKIMNIQFSNEIIKNFFQMETIYHRDQATEMPLHPEADSLGLEEFLNHKDQRIMLQTHHEDTSFPLTWTYKVFNKIKPRTPFKNDEQCTVLKLKRLWAIHQKIANIQRIFKNSSHVLIIEFNALDDSEKTLLENFLSTAQREQNIKLILITQNGKEAEEWIEQKVTNSMIYFSLQFPEVTGQELTEDCRKSILQINVNIQGKRIALDDLLTLEQLNLLDIQALMPLVNARDGSLEVGHGLIRWSDFPAAYRKRLVTIEATTLLSELVNAKPNETLFLISGLHLATPQQLIESLALTFTEDEKVILKYRVSEQFTEGKNIIIIPGDYSEQEFRSFCHEHYKKKIHWVSFSSKRWLWQWFYDPHFYVDRSLKKVAVNSDIRRRLLSDCLEQFIFSGLPSEETLWKLLDITQVEDQEKIKQSSKVFIVEKPEHAEIKFNELVNESSNSISLLQVNKKCLNDQLLWERVHPFQRVTLFGEFTFAHNEPLIVIVDEPGMGKSTTLTWIAEQRQSSAWIIHLHLKDCRDQITQLPRQCPSLSQVRDFLWSGAKNSDDFLAKSAFDNYLTTTKDTPFPLLILLDGFDEMSQDEQQKVEAVLRVLRDAFCDTKHQVIVTTRHHPELEKHLDLPFTLQFYGFTRPQQKQFVQHFWRKSCELLLNAETAQMFDKKSEAFMNALLEQANNILGAETTTFISIPLQLRLLAESFEEEFVQYLNTDMGHLPLIDTLEMAALYQRFIEAKYLLYFKEKSNLQKVLYPTQVIWIRRTLEKYHCQLAVQVFFLEETSLLKGIPAFWKKSDLDKKEYIEIFRVGLVQKTYRESNFEFIHPTFAEYYAADFLYNQLLKETSNPKIAVVQKFIFKYILIEPMYKVIRLFLNDRFKNFNSEDKLTALGSCISELYEDGKLQDPKTGNTLLHQACKENHLEIIRFLFRALANERKVLNCFMNLKDAPPDYKLFTKFRTFQNTPLHYAAKFGYHNIVEVLLSHGSEVDPVNNYQETPLFLAAAHSNETIVEFLLDNGANVKAKRYDGYTVLHFAARNNKQSLIELLIDKGNDIEATNNEGSTPLMLAAEKGNKTIVEFLLGKGANVKAKRYDGYTVLHFAAKNNKQSLIELLVEKGADVNATDKRGTTPLMLAAENGNETIVEFLLGKGANVKAKRYDGYTVLHFAASYSNQSFLELLVEKGADVNATDKHGTTPLMLAAEESNETIVKFLLDSGANVKAKRYDGYTVLHFAARNNKQSLIELLIDKGNDIEATNNDGSTPLMLAAEESNETIVKFLLDNGANVKAKAYDGYTVLHFASRNNKQSLIELLIDKGNDIEATNNDGSTPLMLAVEKGNETIVEFLLGKGANVKAKRYDGYTVLHFAARNNKHSLIELLVEKGADVNATDKHGTTPLMLAAENGNETIVEFLLGKGANVKAKRYDGYTVLHFAASYSNQSFLELLVEKGADVNATDKHGTTPLMLAAKEGNETIVEFLLDKGANVKAKAYDGYTVLHFFASYSKQSLIELLVEKGADVNATNTERTTPLMLAAEESNETIVKFLLDKGANVKAREYYGYTALHFAARYNNSSLIKLLIEKGADVNATDKLGTTPLMLAAEESNETIVEFLLDNGANVKAKRYDGYTVLHFAARNNKQSLIELLIDKGNDIEATNNDGTTPLMLAAENGNETIVEFLLDNGANVKAKRYDGYTVLHFAASYSNQSFLELLVEKGADVNATDQYGSTPLMLAAEESNETIVEFLLGKGANVKAKRYDGYTVLHFAARNNKQSLIELLIDKGNDIEATNNDGSTPLMLAAEESNKTIVEFLLGKGANVKAKRYDGYTVLHFAARNNKQSFLELLVEKGADVNATDKHGTTPLMLAAEKGNESIVEFLLDKGANVKAKGYDCYTALHFAARYNNPSLIKLLIEKGADVNVIANDKRTPVILAAEKGNETVVKLLLDSGANVKDKRMDGLTVLHSLLEKISHR